MPISDTHIGDANFNETKLKETIRQIKETPNMLTLLNGDIINNALKCSVSNCFDDVMSPKAQIKYAINLFKPIANKIIGVNFGNHENRTANVADMNPAEVIATGLGVQYFGAEVLLKIKFGKKTEDGNPLVYSVYATHGGSSGSNPGSKVNAIQKLKQIVVADAYIMSHTHQLDAHPSLLYLPDLQKNLVREQRMYLVMCGGYLDRGGYAVTKNYSPLVAGSPLIALSGKRKNINVTI